MDGSHIVDVRRARNMKLWEVVLNNGMIMHVSTFNHPDELSAFTFVTNRLKEQANGTNSRA